MYVDKTGAAWTSYHNAFGNPVARVDPLGNRQEFTWSNQQKLAESDGRGYVTSYTHDARGNVLTVTQPDGRVTTRTYEATFSRMLSEASTGLPTVTNTYDTAGRLKTRTDGLGTTTSGTGACQVTASFGNQAPGVPALQYPADQSETASLTPAVPANEIANSLGNPRAANMVALGAYLGATGAVSVAEVEAVVRETFSAKPQLVDSNLLALHRGFEVGAAAVGRAVEAVVEESS